MTTSRVELAAPAGGAASPRSALPLALKYRPRTFAEVVGQSHVTETLRNALRSGRVGAVYLFAGPRGSGKTTMARLLARAVNCTSLADGEPCGECPTCAAILRGQSLDVLEIDAASNRGIEDIRELRERVGYAAVQGEKKIYIVDEVHMLSKDAFNALLKTIEEPPSHVLFIFATTDPQKVLPTVLSRCQRFDFKRITLRDLEARIRHICALESQGITAEATFLIGKKADGSLRDALGMLDQVLSLSPASAAQGAAELDAQRVRDVLGLAGLDRFLGATELIRRRDASGAIRFVRGLVEEGVDLLDFYGGLYEHLRNLMLFVIADAEPSPSEALPEVPAEFHPAYREAARAIGLEDLLRATAILTDYEFAFRGTAHPEYMLEFLLLRLALLDRTADVAQLLEEVRSGSETSAAGSPFTAPADSSTSQREQVQAIADFRSGGEPLPPAMRQELETAPGPVMREAPSDTERAWASVLASVSSQKASLGSILAGLERPALRGDEIVLHVPADQVFAAEALRDQKNRRLLEEVFASVWAGSHRLTLEVSTAMVPGEREAPFRRLDRDDPLVRQALDVFDADLVS
jgi:DNA polymerase-3 subunit gamma/tau